MVTYFVRRLILVPVTFVCITFMVYTVMRMAPGGPIEQAKLQVQMAAMQEGGGGGGLDLSGEGGGIDQEGLDQLKKYYKLDRPIPVGYAIWLGVWPDEDKNDEFSGVLQGDLGTSYRYSDPVVDTIISKFPISLYFGLIGYFSTWLVCIPLGVYKALKHRSLFDTGTSLAVFLGYSIPGFVACLIMLMLFATDLLGIDIFPLGRFRSEDWNEWWANGEYLRCVKDQLWHTAIPVTGYILGSFATMTILMKNSLLENLGADYVRTAFAKGLSEKRVVFLHALRNSLIPICVGVGHALGLLIAGSFLIEKTCNIPGIGLLGFNSVVGRDYPIIMGILVIAVTSRLLGNILSDLVLAIVDPRVRFG